MLSPFFEAYAHDVRVRANADLVLYAPTANDIAGWKNFSVSNLGWLEESLTIFSELEPDSNALVGSPGETNDGRVKVWGPSGDILPSTAMEGEFLPLLHYSPPLTQLDRARNLDLYSNEDIRRATVASVDLGGKNGKHVHISSALM